MRGLVHGLALLAAVALTSCSNGGTTGGDTFGNVECQTAACMLATLDDGGYVAPDDPIVGDYQLALDALTEVCSASEQRLGDFAFETQRQLRNGGVTESLLSILRNIRASIPRRVADGRAPGLVGDCSSLFASYSILRGGQP